MSRDAARSSRSLFVGVDGGGTSTRAAVVDRRGRELARGTGPPSLVEPGDARAAADVVAGVIGDAVRHLRGGRIEVLHAALAGAGREPMRSAVRRALEDVVPAGVVRVGPDVEAAFHDAFGTGPGILVLAGTGSVAWGRSEDGRTRQVGGWGHLLGDEGSGWSIGLECLRSVLRAADGRGPPTRLTDDVIGRLGIDEVEEVLAWARGTGKGEVASLAPLVRKAADAGDPVAGTILEGAVHALEHHATVLARILDPGTPGKGVAEDDDGEPVRVGWTVILAGGLLGPGGALAGPVRKALRNRGLEVAPEVPDAARGAAALAWEAGVGPETGGTRS